MGHLEVRVSLEVRVRLVLADEHQAAHHVLVFRDQHLSNEDHKRFARLFGTLHVHPYNAEKIKAGGTDAPDPEIYEVKADQSSRYVSGEVWHSDVTCAPEPPMGAILHR